MASESPGFGNSGSGKSQSDSSPTDDVRLSARVFGVVQGVGFRFWTMGKADELALKGEVKNLSDGSVAIVAEGPRQQVQKLLDWLRSENAPGRVERVEESVTAAEGSFRDFRAR